MTCAMKRAFEQTNDPLLREGIDQLLAWPCWYIPLKALNELREDLLYHSWIHGVGHVERVIVLGAVLAMDQGFDELDTWYTAQACTYHDIGRLDDSSDIEHSRRSAERLPDITQYDEEALRVVQAAIHAHSGRLNASGCVSLYAPKDEARCHRVLYALRDADRLDRVRLHDLDPSFLHYETSHDRCDFARALFEAYNN